MLRQGGLFNDQQQLSTPLPENWASPSIYSFNPGNLEWQNYIFNREKDVFAVFPFDGWHIDSLGGGTAYDFTGNKIDLDQTFQGFINNAKATLGKSVVFNSVGNYGQKESASSSADILYSEMWEGSGQITYNDLKNSIDAGNSLSGGSKSTVLAAYMNRNYQKNFSEFNQGYFNTPSILLTDATIFASGGSHIELGDDLNMLSLEYFPNKHLIMSNELKQQLKNYYDFMVAYENLLRGGLSNTHNIVYVHDMDSNTSTDGSPNTIWKFTKTGNGYDVIHLINLLGVPSNHWRDADATYPVPNFQSNITVKYYYGSGTVESVNFASPDYDNGKSYSTSFTTGSDDQGNYVTFTVPTLQYWDMIYIKKS
ncbi:glycoside hydrolase family 66 protein [Paenibacillus caui]|uniref:glycoside hydrolase family 66 protein n=1 Tax=Paenibacillus caui TaxID=2873927 RepID=UPI001CA869BB|nr:glycoside hydrolase family 66 protein [Paenibacillus caui]